MLQADDEDLRLDLLVATAQATAADARRSRRYQFFTFLLVLLTVIYFTRDLLLPIVIAIILTLTLLPAVRFGERYRVPAPMTAVLVIVLIGATFAEVGYALSGPMQDLAADAPQIATDVQDKLGGMFERLASLRDQANGLGGAEATPTLIDTNGDGFATTPVVTVAVQEDAGGIADQVLAGAASASGAIAGALVLTIFLLAGGDFYHRRIIEAMPRLKDKKQALTIIRDVERQISRYLGAIFLINAALGIAVGLTMWALSMPTPVVWGVLAFLLNFIPFVGNVVNLVMIAAISIVTFDTLWGAALPPLALLVLSLIESNVVTPIVIGRRLEINTVSQLVIVGFWSWVWGVPGAILAVPFLVVVKAVTDNVESLQVISTFLAGDPSTKEDEPPQKATTGPAREAAPVHTLVEARTDSPPTQAPGAIPVTPLATS